MGRPGTLFPVSCLFSAHCPSYSTSVYSAREPRILVGPLARGVLWDCTQVQSKCAAFMTEAGRANNPERPHFPSALELVFEGRKNSKKAWMSQKQCHILSYSFTFLYLLTTFAENEDTEEGKRQIHNFCFSPSLRIRTLTVKTILAHVKKWNKNSWVNCSSKKEIQMHTLFIK